MYSFSIFVYSSCETKNLLFRDFNGTVIDAINNIMWIHA